MTALRASLIAAFVFFTLLAWKAESLVLAALAFGAERVNIDQRAALLAPAVEYHFPENAAGPFPVILQVHGCAGIRPAFHRQWADIGNAAGYAVAIIDSFGPRGLSRDKALETVCTGKRLIGQERAGDIAAALQLIAKDSRFDQDQIILAGWSHGGWTLMDYLTMDMARRRPAGFNPLNFEPPELKAAIVFYPHCGWGTLSRSRQWVDAPEMIAFIAGDDEIVDGPECNEFLERRRAAGEPIEIVFYGEANHVFDDPFLEPEYLYYYNEALHADATARYLKFLGKIKSQSADE